MNKITKNQNKKRRIRKKACGFHTLYLELTLTVLVCVAGALLLFFLLHTLSDNLSDSQYLRSVWLSKKTQKDVASLQKYITDNELSSADLERIDEWQQKHPYTTIGLKRGDTFFYDSTTYGETDSDAESWILEEPEWFSIYPVTLSDGSADLYIDCYYTSLVEMTCNLINVTVCIVVFCAVLILSIRKKIRYISKLNDGIHILEGGNLEYEIPVCGNDELSSLAVSLNEMRRSLSVQLEHEQRFAQVGNDVVATLVHDLRTPLTTQTGYLEILKEHQYQTEDEMQLYLGKCLTVCKQLGEMSNNLFAYFLPFHTRAEESAVFLETYDGMEFLMQMLTEQIANLEEKGLRFELDIPEALFYIKVNVNYMYRIFNNIFSNIEKYAERSLPVCIRITLGEGQCTIAVTNHISEVPYSADSSRVGLESIRGLIGQMDGTSRVIRDKESFTIQITLPVFYRTIIG